MMGKLVCFLSCCQIPCQLKLNWSSLLYESLMGPHTQYSQVFIQLKGFFLGWRCSWTQAYFCHIFRIQETSGPVPCITNNLSLLTLLLVNIFALALLTFSLNIVSLFSLCCLKSPIFLSFQIIFCFKMLTFCGLLWFVLKF